jgi:hypothetical protein
MEEEGGAINGGTRDEEDEVEDMVDGEWVKLLFPPPPLGGEEEEEEEGGGSAPLLEMRSVEGDGGWAEEEWALVEEGWEVEWMVREATEDEDEDEDDDEEEEGACRASGVNW